MATTVTDANGGYLFDNLPAGDLLRGRGREHVCRPGMTQTPPSTLPGADFGNQDQSTGSGDYGYPVSLPSGGENLTADFGYNYNASTNVNNPPANPTLAETRPMLRRQRWATGSGSTRTAMGCRIPTRPGSQG